MSRLRRTVLSCALLAVVLFAGPALAEDLGGLWSISAATQPEARVETEVPIPNCMWTGEWNLAQSGTGELTGTVTLNLDVDDSDSDCPDPMTAMLSGTNDSGNLSGTIGGPMDNLGEVMFTGSVAGTVTKSMQVQAATTAAGSFSVVGGLYTGAPGIWSGSLAPAMPDIPPLGIAALLLLLFFGGSVLLLRRQRT